MPVVRTEEAKVHELHGARFVAYANPGSGSRELCAWRTEIPAGTAGRPHTVTREEILLVLSGFLRFTVDGEAAVLGAGDALIVNPGSTLRVDNESDAPAHIWVTSSVGLEAVMEDGTRVRPHWANA